MSEELGSLIQIGAILTVFGIAFKSIRSNYQAQKKVIDLEFELSLAHTVIENETWKKEFIVNRIKEKAPEVYESNKLVFDL